MKKIYFSLAAFFLAIPFAAAAAVQIDPSDPFPVPFNSTFFNIGGPAGKQSASGFIVSIIDILLIITGILAVLFIVIGGLRYITAAGNEETAEAAKKTITHAVIGLVIVILSFVVVRVISNALILGRLGT